MGTKVAPCLILTLLLGGALMAQQKPSPPAASVALEFPVTLRQNVEAGKTAVGTKVEAKLTLATLVNGVVVPEGAVFSGEVVESTAKTASDPSRLAIRMDLVEWKKGSAPVKVYLSAWYYPPEMHFNHEHSDWGPTAPAVDLPPPTQRYPGATTPRLPDPRGESRRDPEQGASNHRIPIKDVEAVHSPTSGVAITSKRSNIKLDKSLTYVFVTEDLVGAK